MTMVESLPTRRIDDIRKTWTDGLLEIFDGSGTARFAKRHARTVGFAHRIFAGYLFLALLVASGATRSADVELMAGDSVTSSQRSTPVAAGNWAGEIRQWRGIAFQPELGLTYVASRQHQGADFGRGAWVAAVGVRFPEITHHMFFSFQVGAAAPQTPALSSTQQFVSSLGWSCRHVVIELRHISNGRTRAPNLGETMLLVGIVLPVAR